MIFRKTSQRARHYTTLILVMVCLCAKSKNGLKIIVRVMILIMSHVINELKLSWATLVLCPHFPQAYICTRANLSLSDLVGDSSLLGKYLVNNPLIFQKSLMPPTFGSVQSKNCCNYTKKKGAVSSSAWRNICNLFKKILSTNIARLISSHFL